MVKLGVGNWVVLGGFITFIIGSLFWAILFSIFQIISWGFYTNLIVIPSLVGLCCIIIGCLINEKRSREDTLPKNRHRVIGIIFTAIGIYIFLALMLIDSPVGPPLLGSINMDVNMDGLFVTNIFISTFILILSGVGLSLRNSKICLAIGIVALVISIDIFLSWMNEIVFAEWKSRM